MIETETSINLLKSCKIRVTANRIIILKALSEKDYPLSLSDLEKILPTIDKSNIFRSLLLFRTNHLVHAFEVGNDLVKYELCLSHGTENDEDIHVHFYCECCQRTFCMNEIHVPQVNLPKGYEAATVNYMVKGLCPRCARKEALNGKYFL